MLRPDNLPDIDIKYKKYWHSILYPSQTMLDHGCSFLSVPKFFCRTNNNVPLNKLKLAWTLSSLLLSSQELWTSIENTSLFKSK